MKLYRERIKADPEKHDEMKKYEKERKAKYRERKKTLNNNSTSNRLMEEWNRSDQSYFSTEQEKDIAMKKVLDALLKDDAKRKEILPFLMNRVFSSSQSKSAVKGVDPKN
ncbi:CLUMA_CG004911, isoform A [Clunio marinus]|uniref:CLUMA_CG004911, isoform A n=1 Tax=Clunio marinus TaxID=568069 RepID=A0A1J1HTA9_9DIPT|nr:CLUMA_CG004911, isoform A [Clunio marinus]